MSDVTIQPFQGCGGELTFLLLFIAVIKAPSLNKSFTLLIHFCLSVSFFVFCVLHESGCVLACSKSGFFKLVFEEGLQKRKIE